MGIKKLLTFKKSFKLIFTFFFHMDCFKEFTVTVLVRDSKLWPLDGHYVNYDLVMLAPHLLVLAAFPRTVISTILSFTCAVARMHARTHTK